MSFGLLVKLTAACGVVFAIGVFWIERMWEERGQEGGKAKKIGGRIRRTVGGVAAGFGVFVALGAFTIMTPPSRLEWEKSLPAAVAKARKAGKPIFIDYTAVWCSRCNEIERQSFSRPEFLEALKGYIAVKVDCSQGTAALDRAKKLFGHSNLPMLVFVAPGKAGGKGLLGKGARKRVLTPGKLGKGDATKLLVREAKAFAKGERAAGGGGGGFAAALKKGLIWAILAAFLGGLLSAMTPCVFPMIPVTAGVIGSAAGGSKLRALMLSLLYVGGIVLTFSAAGLAAGATGAAFGRLMQSPWVPVGMAALFLVLAGHMLELYRIGLFDTLQTRVGSKGGSTRGALAVFIMGLLAGFIFAPCVGPILFGVLGFIARTADLLLGFLFLVSFGLGLGVPFVLVGVFSGVAATLRKTDRRWLRGVEAAFGCLLIAACLYYLVPVLPPLRAMFGWLGGLAG